MWDELLARGPPPYSPVRGKGTGTGPAAAGIKTAAQPLIADRVGLPAEVRNFSAQPFLSPLSEAVLTQPSRFLISGLRKEKLPLAKASSAAPES